MCAACRTVLGTLIRPPGPVPRTPTSSMRPHSRQHVNHERHVSSLFFLFGPSLCLQCARCAGMYTYLVSVAGKVRDERLKAQRTNFNIINITYFDEAFIAFALIPDACSRRQNVFDIQWRGESEPGQQHETRNVSTFTATMCGARCEWHSSGRN